MVIVTAIARGRPRSWARWSATTVGVIGTFHSTPGTTFLLDFYANAAADPSGYGEGQRWLGSATVTTDSSGNASFLANGPGIGSVIPHRLKYNVDRINGGHTERIRELRIKD